MSIPLILIPGHPILIENGREQILDRYDEMDSPYVQLFTNLFEAAVLGLTVRIRHFLEGDILVDWMMEKTDDGWQLFLVRYQGKCPKQSHLCVSDMLLEIFMNDIQDQEMLAAYLHEAEYQMDEIDALDKNKSHFFRSFRHLNNEDEYEEYEHKTYDFPVPAQE